MVWGKGLNCCLWCGVGGWIVVCGVGRGLDCCLWCGVAGWTVVCEELQNGCLF